MRGVARVTQVDLLQRDAVAGIARGAGADKSFDDIVGQR